MTWATICLLLQFPYEGARVLPPTSSYSSTYAPSHPYRALGPRGRRGMRFEQTPSVLQSVRRTYGAHCFSRRRAPKHLSSHSFSKQGPHELKCEMAALAFWGVCGVKIVVLLVYCSAMISRRKGLPCGLEPALLWFADPYWQVSCLHFITNIFPISE